MGKLDPKHAPIYALNMQKYALKYVTNMRKMCSKYALHVSPPCPPPPRRRHGGKRAGHVQLLHSPQLAHLGDVGEAVGGQGQHLQPLQPIQRRPVQDKPCAAGGMGRVE